MPYWNIASDNEPLAYFYLTLMLHTEMANTVNLIGSNGKDEASDFSIWKVFNP